jgi:hypothetical protein
MADQRPYTGYKFARMATKTAFLDLTDMHAPCRSPEIFPSSDDLKQKIQLSYTQINLGNGPSTFFRHYLDLDQCEATLEAMRMIEMGREKDNCLPGFPEFKGSPDRMYPQWDLVSRVLTIRYLEGKFGPSYSIEFTVGEGRATQTGAVQPAGSSDDKIKGACVLPMIGTDRLPPVGMKFVTRALAYLRGRESARQVIMSQSMSNLVYLAGQGNTDARQRLDQISRDLDGERKGSDRGGGGDRQRSHPDDDRR